VRIHKQAFAHIKKKLKTHIYKQKFKEYLLVYIFLYKIECCHLESHCANRMMV
jgi:hypothetical protein